MRESRNVARKRRLTVLRQLASPHDDDGPDVLSTEHGTEHLNQAGDIQAFATACEAQLPLRLQVTDERTGQSEELLIDRPFAHVGSSELCDVRLPHPDVSRCHAYLQVLEGRVLCCDLGSRTGTHWGEEIRSRGFLEPGEPLHVGPYSLRLVRNEFADPPSDEMPVALAPDEPLRAPVPNIALTFLNARNRVGSSRISSVRNPVTLVGWSHLCHLRLQHRSVGRVHCCLVWTPGGLWAVDLMCRGGTRVNGELINFARLDDGDTMELGRFQLKVGYGSSREMPIFNPDELPQTAAIVPFPQRPQEAPPAIPSPAADELPAHSAGPPQVPVVQVETRPELSDLRQPARPIAMPMPAAADLSPANAGDSTAVTLMQQFAVMQQQMFDHTYQLLAVVTQAFQTAHNRQLQLIREELMRVHELNRELYDLNRRRGTVDTSPEAAIGGAPGNASASENLAQQLFPGLMLPVPAPAEPAADVSPPASRPPEVTGQENPLEAPLPAGEPLAAAESSLRAATPPEPASATVGETPTELPPKKRRAKQEPRRTEPATAGAPTPEPDVHAWLSGRINELTKERSSRWQRILQLLTNGGG